jgi:membrane associated rhomboid family serine protease
VAVHNRDYMGGAAPPSGSHPGSAPRFRGYQVLIALNVVVFLLWLSDSIAPTLVEHCVVSKHDLLAGKVWPLIGASFLHTDLIHMLTTLVILWWAGKVIEEEYGASTLVITYLVGGVATGIACAFVYGSGSLMVPPGGSASGTGFYVAERLVVTNAHVVGDASEVELSVGPQGAPTTGKVLATDESLDLALIKVELPGTPLFYSDQVVPGRIVFVLGFGVLGGDNKTLLVTRGTASARQASERRIVFDATVNPGNSGGPLLDTSERWIGVVAAKSSGDGRLVTSLGYAIDGEATVQWLAKNDCAVRVARGAPTGDTPPKKALDSVVRVLVKGGAPIRARAEFRRNAYKMDNRVFGASGGVWALAFFFLFRWPRREISIAGSPVPLLVVFLFFALADLGAALRAYGAGFSFSHAYHFAGGGAGFLLHWFGVEKGVGGLSPRLKIWWRNRRQGPPPMIQFPGSTSAPQKEKLSPAERERMDTILAKVSATGIDSLTPEERAYLEQASGKLRGND